VLTLLHILLLVYWLGADVGTYHASRFVADPGLPAAARGVAARIMLDVDLLPRVAMPLTLATGAHLTHGLGLLPLGATGVALAWAVCGAWLTMVLAIHHLPAARSRAAAVLTRLDFAFRVTLALLLAAAGLGALLVTQPALPAWLAVKLMAFAGTMVCGLMIRVHLRPFGAAFARVKQGGSAAELAESNATVAQAIARCKPFVLVIWALLVLCAAAGLHLLPS
jgi:hypothetical protein